jgi:hypothetical protein
MNLNSIFAALGTLLYVTVLLGAATGVAPLRKLTPAHGASAGCLPSRDGFLRVRLRGDADTDIDWTDPDMQCDGGVRPDESGVRVTFAGHLPDGHIIRLVFGIAVPLATSTARNVATNVTVIFEDQQKLYSTAGEGKCTIDDLSMQPQPAPSKPGWRRIVARGFCSLPVAALAGSDALDALIVDRFDFAGGVTDEDLH